jgi:hypothetical protein
VTGEATKSGRQEPARRSAAGQGRRLRALTAIWLMIGAIALRRIFVGRRAGVPVRG